MSSLFPEVIAGLVVGSGMIVVFSVAFHPLSSTMLIDENTSPLRTANTDRALEIIENNTTIVEHYKKKFLSVFHVTDRFEAGENCPFGSCARVFAQSQSGYLSVYVNYESGYVAACFEQRHDAFYNCAGELLRRISPP
jgi:hypothetical protein